jgi:hypothetical protein
MKSLNQLPLARKASMTTHIIADTLHPFMMGIRFMIPAAAIVVIAKIILVDSNSSMRPEGCRRGEKSTNR